MENQVHIMPQKLEEGQKYDPSLNSLVLKKAEAFYIKIKELEDLKKQKPIAPKPITELSNQEYNNLTKTGRWNYDVDVKQYNTDFKKYNDKLKLYNERLKIFDNLNWAWQIVYNELEPNKVTHNVSFQKGIHQRISFPELLEGGGIAWLEAWYEQEKPKGKAPFGMYVQAEGVSRVIRTEWTDSRYETITEATTLAFGSKVILHIYTAGLYGQEVEVHLVDQDIFTSNDKLKISGEDFFVREVKVHKLKPNDLNKNGVSGVLTVEEARVNYAQKIELEVVIDKAWIKAAGENLKIFPIIKSIKKGTFFTDFGRSYLHVSTDKKSIPIDEQPLPVNNMPLIVGDVETNVAAFHPCQYTEVDFYNEKNEKTNLFTQNTGVSQPPNLEIGIIAGEDPKKFSLKVDDKAKNNECRFHGKSNDHEKNIFTYDKTKPIKNITIVEYQPKHISGTVFFDYERSDMMKYFYLPNDFSKIASYPHIKINALSCRHQNYYNLTVLPDIEWELAFIITTTAGFRVKADNTTFTRLNQGLGEYQFKGIKAEQTGKLIEKGGLGYSLNIKYTINNGAFYEQISLDFVRNIEKIIGNYNAIAGFAAIFKSDENNVSSAAISKSVVKKMTFDIEPPAVVFLLKWKYDYAKKNKKPVVNFTGAAGFKPLIGLKIGFDITQNLGMFGMVGKAIEWLLDIIEKLVKEDIYILAEAGSALNYDMGLSYNEIDGFAPNTKQKAVLDVTFSFKVGIKKKDTIFIPDVRRMSENTISTNEAEIENFKIEGAVTTGIRYTEEHGYEKGKGKYKKTETKWLGAEMTITVVTLAHNRKQNAPPNNQFKEKFLIMSPVDISPVETEYEKNA